ncbi:MAG: lipoate--protein ligase family protein [Nitrospira sp.]|nr:lipoate--protein ligase family protein [Nitrospira sp.]
MSDIWRFIDTGPCNAAYNMALDETIASLVRKEDMPPVLRLYGWNTPSVSIGCFQKISDVDIIYCTEKNIPIVRRPTGGRAIFHTHEITYSLSVQTKSGLFSKGLLDSYKKISTALGLALSKIGFTPELKVLRETARSSPSDHSSKSPLCFKSISYGEVSVNNIKIIGSAQKRWTDGLLQHGSIPLTFDRDGTRKIFRVRSDNSIMESSKGLNDIFPDLQIGSIKNAIRISFEETFDVKLILTSPSYEESSLAQELEARKYLSDEWNFKR